MAQKINADVMKQNNRKEVLRLIRKEPCSRIKLAEKMGLTRAAISFICENSLVLNMLFSAFVGYIAGFGVKKWRGKIGAKLSLIGAIVIDIGLLGVFKYTGFF